ncbi:MAG TPA: lysophospholipid acyltransferase family protein [Acidocella sp.]|jgi:1-acyl-sn-glycerol-3-phosphate acyltransferase|uniref:lysophospholipid acyltransferase family protein n=1 Tax=Acidocella sp. TaxID=50710 RepID=UPI002BC6F7B1|nr:lysophospholipid acyltransferase family protein [Acidocella sp.]HVE21894.1 lysophospholipid acyltransferase family protein [Acidocella sp.]
MIFAGLVLSLWGTILRVVAPHRLTSVAQLWARICLAALRRCCGIHIGVEGLENLPAGGAIIAAQHQSALDILVWLVALPYPALVFKKELRKIPVFGPLLAPTGMIPVDRSGAAPALRKLLQDCRAAAAAGRQVVIFPEGTRVAPGARADLQPGIVALAKSVGVPVLPATTDSGACWGPRAFVKTSGTVTVRLLPPLPAGLTRETIITELSGVYYGAH